MMGKKAEDIIRIIEEQDKQTMDEIKAEFKEYTVEEMTMMDRGFNNGLKIAMEIIDKYLGDLK